MLLILFSHTCPDCKSLFDDVMLYKDDIERLGATTIAVSRGGSTEDIEAYMNLHGYTFDAIADGDAAIYRLYATTYVPRTYLINRQGLVEFTTIEYSSTYLVRNPALARQSRKPTRRRRHREMRAFFSCMAWRGIPIL